MVAASLLVIAACGNRSNDKPLDEAVKAVSEHAVQAWSESGPAGLHDYLSVSVQAHCSVARLQDVMASQPKPHLWKETKDITSKSSSETSATVVFESDGQDVEQTWSFALENFSWRVSEMPGLSGCTTS